MMAHLEPRRLRPTPPPRRPPLRRPLHQPRGLHLPARAGDVAALLQRLAVQHAGMAVTLVLLAALCALQALALLRTPDAWLPRAIHIALAPGETVTLGRRELAAPHADRAHLALRRDTLDGWMLRNQSATRQVVVLRGADDNHPGIGHGALQEQRLGSTALATGDVFQVDGALFKVTAAAAGAVEFTRHGSHWRYDGATLHRDGRAQPDCPASRLSTRLLARWNRLAPHALTVARPLAFGGNLYCGNRLGLERVTPGAAMIARSNGGLQLASGNPDGERAAVLVNGLDLRRQEVPLAGAQALIVGHTQFQLDLSAGRLTLAPARQVALHGAPDLELPAAVTWDWQRRDAFHGAERGAGAGMAAWWAIAVASVAVFTAGIVAAVGSAHGTSCHTSAPIAAATTTVAAVLLLAAGMAALLAQRAGLAPGAALSLLLGASALVLWLILPGRLTLLTAAGVILLAIGLLTQLELGLGAPQTTWLRYYQKSAALLAIGCGAGGLLRTWAWRRMAAPRAHAGPAQQRAVEWLLAGFASVALAGLAAQVLWGDEGGVFDLQPVELAKLALAALTAHCLALRFGWHSDAPHPADQGARWLRLVAPALLFLALLGLALVQVDDFSPLILLLAWCAAMALAYALLARRHVLTAVLLVLALLAVAAVAWLRLAGSADLVHWGFYADRFLVWLNPAEHPHTGQQLLLGARAIAEGGWLGADGWLGLRTLGRDAGSVMQIPAVQDDFAASFFINRHGLAGALLLWCAQAAFLCGVVQAARAAVQAASRARNFRQAWAARCRYFALCGGGAFVLGHFLLSWGTNLAIFPIMGQPMSFLSAGGSHLLFFLCPLLAFSAAGASPLEGE